MPCDTTTPHVLYAMPGSLYSAKARAYLVARGIEFEERPAGHPRYNEAVVPAIGRWIIPVLECPDGTFIQDSLDIQDHFESTLEPEARFTPTTPKQAAVAHVLELFGGEGLLRPAMHYRWNFDEMNVDFLKNDFVGGLAPGATDELRDQVFAVASGRMRAATVAFGVTDETMETVVASYAEFLSLLDAHLADSPYLLGGQVSIADTAFMGPLYPHLARDPAPSQVMKSTAWRVWRWVERMLSGRLDAQEYVEVPEGYFPGDEVPETMRRLLRYIAEEYVAEIDAQVAAIDGWLDENEVAEGDVCGGAPKRRTLTSATFEWRGHTLEAMAMPYRLVVLQRLQDTVEAMAPADRTEAAQLLESVGLASLLTLRARRRVERVNNAEVWGPEQVPSYS